jgi:hypothetical protein
MLRSWCYEPKYYNPLCLQTDESDTPWSPPGQPSLARDGRKACDVRVEPWVVKSANQYRLVRGQPHRRQEGVFGRSQGQVHPSDRMEKSMRSGSGDVSRNMNAAPLLRLRAQTGGEYIYAIDMTILTSRYEKELIVSN